MSILWAVNNLAFDNHRKERLLSKAVEATKSNVINSALWIFTKNSINNASNIIDLYEATTREKWVKNKTNNKKIMLIEMVKYHDRYHIIKVLSKQLGNRIDFISVKSIARELWFNWDSDFTLFRELTLFSEKYWNIFWFFLQKLKQKLIN